MVDTRKEKQVTFFKVLNGVEPTHGGTGRYPGVGRWTRHIDGPLEACRVGFHLADETQLLDWLGPTIYEAEPCPNHEPVDAGDKWVTCRVRLAKKLNWDERTARLFAADMAESALLGERASGREPDVRSWDAVAKARLFAVGELSVDQLDAARHAAWDAAWAAARDAARHAAWDAARHAARDAARHAAWDAAWAAARERLLAYLYDRPIPEVTALYGIPERRKPQ